jgi:serine/threonine protein kinase
VSTDKIEFLKEKTILDVLGPQNHPHLIQLLASYHKDNYYHLIFPCADSNLKTYWAQNKTPDFDKETVLWSIRQMSGIASALDYIHSFKTEIDLDVEGGIRIQDGVKLSVKKGEEKYGRHGDIKPENILWFNEGNVLKITDFGLGRFHGRDSRSGIDPRKVASSLTYEPPECKIGRPVSRAYDIWSLACLFLEFVTWLLEGDDQIEEFANVRGEDVREVRVEERGEINDDNFFTTFIDDDREKNAIVRYAVIQWVDRIHSLENCSEVIHDILDLIMGGMLNIDPSDRIKAPELKEKMEKYVKKAERTERYLIRSAPRPSTTPPAVPKPSTGQKEVHWADQHTLATT